MDDPGKPEHRFLFHGVMEEVVSPGAFQGEVFPARFPRRGGKQGIAVDFDVHGTAPPVLYYTAAVSFPAGTPVHSA